MTPKERISGSRGSLKAAWNISVAALNDDASR
uniref:Uncharacterized protein n=1 Tax=Erwinia amylovora ATCC BAA-2158 TaxID=889211 RepID=E5BAD3_ERWAM|nr:hypothetical protein predicted by Glimmer/Critica [Erwinia amylovora ATCC BAA-2158]